MVCSSLKFGYYNTPTDMEICLILLIIRERQTRTTMRYYFTAVRIAVVTKVVSTREVEEVETLVHYG